LEGKEVGPGTGKEVGLSIVAEGENGEFRFG